MRNKVIIGSFLEENSFFHRVHPIVKILLFAMITIFAITTKNTKSYIVVSCLILFGSGVTKIGIKNLLKAIKPIIGIIVFSLLLQVVFNKEGKIIYQLGFFKLYSTTITFTINTFLRFFIMVGSAAIVTLSTEPIELTHGLELFFKPLKLFKIPIESIALTISLALRFIPLYFQEIERVKVAQATKGYDLKELRYFERFKFYGKIMTPLIISSINRAEDLANAMEVRGYSIKGKKTRFRKYSVTKEDYILITIFIIFIGKYYKIYNLF